MQISKIKRALMGDMYEILTDQGGFGWLGDGHAFYVVDDNLDLTSKNLLAIMDIPADKRRHYTVYEKAYPLPCFDLCPQEDADFELHEVARVMHAGSEIVLLADDDGTMVMVYASQLRPCMADMRPRICLRTSADPDTGELTLPVVAVFNDMLVSAIIRPLPVELAREILSEMRAACGPAYRYLGDGAETEEPAQISLFERRAD